MLATLNGSSLLPSPVPFPVTFTGNQPVPQLVRLVSNAGNAPVRLLNVEMWQSADGGTSPNVRCSDVDAGPCALFNWITPPTFPVLLEGTSVPSALIDKVVGTLAYGTLDDAGVYQVPSQQQRVFAVVGTSDPYTPTVTVAIIGRLQP